ncbi:MAG: hypothetical protein Q8Q91_02155, partial [Candidatus Daviesbacteria bacterium]|nr:hypothetical protein [Candidatus Daviesbacteria bacterium]
NQSKIMKYILSDMPKKEKLPKMSSPCLVILFDHDEVIKNSIKETYQKTVIIPGVHETPLLRPEAIILLIEKFLEKNR